MTEVAASLVNWLPFLILVGIYLVLSRRSLRNSSAAVAQNQEILDINRRMLVALEEISAELKQRKS
jgi:hypothetical protein